MKRNLVWARNGYVDGLLPAALLANFGLRMARPPYRLRKRLRNRKQVHIQRPVAMYMAHVS
jgi:hypothetical protein